MSAAGDAARQRGRHRRRGRPARAISAGSVASEPRHGASSEARSRQRRQARGSARAAEEARDLEVVGVVAGRRTPTGSTTRAAVAVRGARPRRGPRARRARRSRSSGCAAARAPRGSRAARGPPRRYRRRALAREAAPWRLPSKPVAMTVIATSSPRRSLKLVPKMMFASGSAAERISSAASVTSNRDMFERAGDVEQDALGARDVDLEQRAGDGLAGRLDGAVLAGRPADAHERRAGVLHDRPHVGEVEVDQPGHGDDVADALDALAQDVVDDPERVEDRRVLLDDVAQPVVRDGDERVDLGLERLGRTSRR